TRRKKTPRPAGWNGTRRRSLGQALRVGSVPVSSQPERGLSRPAGEPLTEKEVSVREKRWRSDMAPMRRENGKTMVIPAMRTGEGRDRRKTGESVACPIGQALHTGRG